MNAWTFGLVKRLLPYWRDLDEGFWPRDPSSPAGYKGQVAESGGFEHAVEASADFFLAVRRLRAMGKGHVANAVEERYWRGRFVPWKAEELAGFVLMALSKEVLASPSPYRSVGMGNGPFVRR